jgi:CPA1 family monovalent cation:H+ antiporter
MPGVRILALASSVAWLPTNAQAVPVSPHGPGAVEHVVEQYAWLLLGAALVGMLAWRLNIPHAVALFLGGLLVAQSGLVSVPDLNPRLLLFVFLPPLLFDAAFRLDARQLRIVSRPVLLLAIPGVLISTLIVGVVLATFLHLPLTIALLFGSIVAATDPVAVISVFKHLRVPDRLAVIVEAESLINDGMAITVYITLLDLVITGSADAGNSLLLFGREVIGGLLVGAVLGFLFSRLTSLVDDHQVEMMLSTALAYGSFLIAQRLEASGALACVAAGLIHGSYGREVGMTHSIRQRLDDLWEYLGFVANALVFLLLGFTVDLRALAADAWPALLAIIAVLVARVLMIALTARVTPPQMRMARSRPERAILIWGGFRGALTAALALALPGTVPHRELLIAMAFGVVLFTLVVQGLTLPLLIRRLGLTQP